MGLGSSAIVVSNHIKGEKKMPITPEQIMEVHTYSNSSSSKENSGLIDILIRAVVSGDDSELVRHCELEAKTAHLERCIRQKEQALFDKYEAAFWGINK
jgi:hypothetical protein